MEGYGSTEAGVHYLSCYPKIYYNVSICPVLCPSVIVGYFSACNEIDNHNRIHQYDLALDKYWLDQSGYFMLVDKVTLVMGITGRGVLFCHGIS